MKKIILLLMSFTVFFAACSSDNSLVINEKYTISRKDGKQYITFSAFSEDSSNTDGSSDSFYMNPLPTFTSIGEMKQSIATGNIPEDELNTIRKRVEAAEQTGQLYEIVNVVDVFDVVLPANQNLEITSILWGGHYYSFQIGGDLWGGIECCTETYWTEQYEDQYVNYFNSDNLKVTSTENISERSATVYYYTSPNAGLKRIRYTISEEGKLYYVDELYVLSHKYDQELVNESVPEAIYIYGTTEDCHFVALLSGMEERPSLEFLSEIELRAYTES